MAAQPGAYQLIQLIRSRRPTIEPLVPVVTILRRWGRSPILVPISGLVVAGCAAVLVFAGAGVTSAEARRTATVVLAAMVAATVVSAAQSWLERNSSRQLTAAADEARVDSLTGLINRTELYRELDASKELAEREQTVFGVLFLDLDRFKMINDSLGHDVGDELLRIVADRLRSATRRTDVVSRLGGDEFVVITRSLMTPRSVEAVAVQIARRLSEPVALRGRQQVVSASVGVAIAGPDDERSADELIRDADLAMYKAKRDGSGHAVFDAAQRSELTDRLNVERELREGLERNELVVHYQPVIGLGGGLYGLEALVRWNHPVRGMVGPGLFLPVAGDAKLMGTIGELVLREACAQAAIWTRSDTQRQLVRVGVNVAEQQLAAPDFPALVAEVLDWSGLRPEQLVLEITEDVVMDHLDGVKVLRQLRSLGVELAIDDFGTGQSSLSYVKRLDMVSILKIDRSFVSDVHHDGVNRAIVEAVVAMASALDLKVVAEGVELPEHVAVLEGLGVDLIQGYLIERPRPAAELSDSSGRLIEPSLSTGSATTSAPRQGQYSAAHSSSGPP